MTDQSGGPGAAGSYAFENLRAQEQELRRLRTQAEAPLPLEREIWRKLRLGACQHVLDLACGPGLITEHLAREAPQAQVLGVDLSEELLDEARRRRAEAGLSNLDYTRGDVYALEQPEAQFDLVYARLLFQHLQHPRRALRSIRRVLAPGGAVCIVDVDDDWLLVEPEPPGFRSFTERAARGQALRGGDRRVGRKLAGYLHGEGYAEIGVEIVALTSFQIGLEAFLNITTNFKLEQIPEEERQPAVSEHRAIQQLLQEPFAWGAVGGFVVTGRRPR